MPPKKESVNFWQQRSKTVQPQGNGPPPQQSTATPQPTQGNVAPPQQSTATPQATQGASSSIQEGIKELNINQTQQDSTSTIPADLDYILTVNPTTINTNKAEEILSRLADLPFKGEIRRGSMKIRYRAFIDPSPSVNHQEEEMDQDSGGIKDQDRGGIKDQDRGGIKDQVRGGDDSRDPSPTRQGSSKELPPSRDSRYRDDHERRPYSPTRGLREEAMRSMRATSRQPSTRYDDRRDRSRRSPSRGRRSPSRSRRSPSRGRWEQGRDRSISRNRRSPSRGRSPTPSDRYRRSPSRTMDRINFNHSSTTSTSRRSTCMWCHEPTHSSPACRNTPPWIRRKKARAMDLCLMCSRKSCWERCDPPKCYGCGAAHHQQFCDTLWLDEQERRRR